MNSHRLRTMSQENSSLSCAMLLAEAALLRWASNIATRSLWMWREANPPNRTKIAKKYATVARLVGAEGVNSDI